MINQGAEIIVINSFEEKYKRIIENSVIETNRVLNAWKISNKKYIYEDVVSLFRSWSSRFIKQEFGWGYFNSNMRHLQILPIIDNHRIINISIPNNYSSRCEKDVKILKTIDILKITELNPIYEREINNALPISITVDYNKINNIKF